MAKKVLVAVFSASGVTKKVGEAIARIAGADFYEIKPVEPYTRADLNWMNKNSRSSVEMNDPSARPAIAGNTLDMAAYDSYFSGEMQNYHVTEEELARFIGSADALNR